MARMTLHAEVKNLAFCVDFCSSSARSLADTSCFDLSVKVK